MKHTLGRGTIQHTRIKKLIARTIIFLANGITNYSLIPSIALAMTSSSSSDMAGAGGDLDLP